MVKVLRNWTERTSAIEIHYEVIHDWPKLAWTAELIPGSGCIKITCGYGVERRKDWFCEAVWDGPFEQGGFDETDIVAGSGGRMRAGHVTFVSSGSILDRLQYMRFAGGWLISNSLVALAARTGASVDPTDAKIRSDFGSIEKGLHGYVDVIPTSRGDIRLRYFDNLVWDGNDIREQVKPLITRDFSNFEKYVGFMQSSMNRVIRNASDKNRRRPIKPLVTMTDGYDSPTIAVLARNAGVKDAVSLDRDRAGKQDNGSEISEMLGLNNTIYPRDQWRTLNQPEVNFIAGSGTAAEAAFISMGDQLDGSLLLSGFYGGIWNSTKIEESPDYEGHDGSGLCFTEARLHMNFIHCPVPFWGRGQENDIIRIRYADEMAAWSIDGDYNKPICRRILESEGVPRDAFGTEKKGASEHVFAADNFMSPASVSDYEHWLWRNTGQWIRRGKVPPWPLFGKIADTLLLKLLVPFGQRVAIPLLRKSATWTGSTKLSEAEHNIRRLLHKLTTVPLHVRKYTFAWALEKAKQAYGPQVDSSNDPVY